MRFLPVVAAALVATVASSGDASAQAHPPLTTTANVSLLVPNGPPGPMGSQGTAGTWGPIVKVVLGRTPGTNGFWYVSVEAPPSGPNTPLCMFKSADRAFLFAFHQKILENLGRAMNLDCNRGTFQAPAVTMINLDESQFHLTVE